MGRVGAVLSLVLLVALLGAHGGPASAQDLDCGDFATQAEAQANADATGDANGLDTDGDGVVCESLGGEPVEPVGPVDTRSPNGGSQVEGTPVTDRWGHRTDSCIEAAVPRITKKERERRGVAGRRKRPPARSR